MEIRPFRKEDAQTLARLSATFARGESDFVLNPLWETEAELAAEFRRHMVSPEEHVLVASESDGAILGMSGFLRFKDEAAAALLPPIVERQVRGRGVGGRLLRAALERAPQLGLRLATAALGSRNRQGQALLTAHGFRPVRQHFFMQCDHRPDPVSPPEGVSLEPADQGDLASMLDLYIEAGFPPRTEAAMASAFVDGKHSHGVARSEGRVVGFIEVETHWPERVWVSYVGVTPPMRERGLGSALVGWALRAEFEGRAQRAMLLLSPANRAALRAYEKVGFGRFRLIDVLEKVL
jgi:ribosomal protein S18 acetylase RimI-like enzyme